MKILYVFHSLSTMGGVQRIITDKANYLSHQFGYDIYIICCIQNPNTPNFYPLSSSIKQINLCIPYYSQYKYKYPKRLWYKYKLNRLLHREITQTVQKIDPDILIGIGNYEANLISTIACKAIKIIECHEARFFMSDYRGERSVLSKLFMIYYRKKYYYTIEKNADMVITLTDQAKELWKKSRRVKVIPNFSSIQVRKLSNCESKRVIAVGRLGKEKGFVRLIETWKIVVSKHPDWQLNIFGDGEQKSVLNNKVRDENIKNIALRGAANDISIEYSMSSICVVTSFFEGFSLVILEAMKHGVPCIAFDCPFGPRSIIEDNKNGFLVEDGNISLFADRVCKLIENESLRKKFGADAIERSKHFDIDSIMNQWKLLFEELICND